MQEENEALLGVQLGPEALFVAVQTLKLRVPEKAVAVFELAVAAVKVKVFVALSVTVRLSGGCAADPMPGQALQTVTEVLHQLWEPVRRWAAKATVVKLETHWKSLSCLVYQHCLLYRTRSVCCVRSLDLAGGALVDLRITCGLLHLHFHYHYALRCPWCEAVVVLGVGQVERVALAAQQVRVCRLRVEACHRWPDTSGASALSGDAVGAIYFQIGDDDECYTVPALSCW